MAGGLGMLALRVSLAAIFIVHALPKIQKPEGMAAGMKWSVGKVKALGFVELLAGLAVGTGIAVELGALAIMAIMVGAIYMKTQKWKVPFTAMDKMGWEFDLILLASAFLVWSSSGYGWGLGMMGRWY